MNHVMVSFKSYKENIHVHVCSIPNSEVESNLFLPIASSYSRLDLPAKYTIVLNKEIHLANSPKTRLE